MGRTAKLHIHNGSWRTLAGNPNGEFFGSVSEVSRKQAEAKFYAYMKQVKSRARSKKSKELTVGLLADMFLDDLRKDHAVDSVAQRQSHLKRFLGFNPTGRLMVRDMPVLQLVSQHLSDYVTALQTAKLANQTINHHIVTVKAMINWGSKNPSPHSLLPQDFKPFANIKPLPVDPPSVSEAELPPADQIHKILQYADIDLSPLRQGNRWRKRELEECVPSDVTQRMGYGDMIRVYLPRKWEGRLVEPAGR